MFTTRLIDPILGQLRQGVSPPALAVSVALGGVLGLFPVPGATTVLCLLAGIALRLNHLVLQAVNYLLYPVQLLLVVPLMQAGQWVFAAEPAPISLERLRAGFEAGWWSALAELWQLTLYAVAAWAALALPAAALVYLVSLPLLRRLHAAMAMRGG